MNASRRTPIVQTKTKRHEVERKRPKDYEAGNRGPVGEPGRKRLGDQGRTGPGRKDQSKRPVYGQRVSGASILQPAL